MLQFWISLSFLITIVNSYNCSWNYRFDSNDNHFNIVYPDDNAVYFGMIIPYGTGNLTLLSDDTQALVKAQAPSHPIAKYFSIQIYNVGDLVASTFHVKDVELFTIDELQNKNTPYELTFFLDKQQSYFALFRIYDSLFKGDDVLKPIYYWSGLPPKTLVDGRVFALCDIDYSQQGNIYTNITSSIHKDTGTICIENDTFMFMEAPPGSLMNADANYMIACIKSNTIYNVSINVPKIMCSLGFNDKDPHPWLNEKYDLRYASLSIVSTTAPRPTIETFAIPCDTDVYTTQIYVNDTTLMPALLYRQLLPDPDFQQSIETAKNKCYDYVNSIYDVVCIQKLMGKYYPTLTKY